MTRNSKNISRPQRATGGTPLDFHIEIMPNGRGYRIHISGVRAVKSFSFECIVVRLKRRVIKILGSDLDIASLEQSVVEISGDIREVELVYDKF